MKMTKTTLFAALAAFLAGPLLAEAKDPGKTLIEDALRQAKDAEKSDPAKAGGLYGQALATTHRLGVLSAEQQAADALEAFVDRIDPDGNATPDVAERPGRGKTRDVLAAVMKALDPKRNGAYVSAHALAAEILSDAVALGDAEHVDEAAAVLAAHASVPKSGKAAALLAQWGEGMRAARTTDPAKAVPALDAAARGFAANGWLAAATWAATESAALAWSGKDAAKTAAALAVAAALVTDASDKFVVQEWMRMVATRLPGAPPEALAPFTRATTSFAGAGSDGAAGGKGGNGASGDGNDVSEVGKILPKWGVDKPFVKATRSKGGFVVQPAYRKEASKPQPFGRGEQHWDDDGGVTLALADRAVALRIVDLKGLDGQPGERLRPSRVRAFYLLADGETWGVTKNGVAGVGP